MEKEQKYQKQVIELLIANQASNTLIIENQAKILAELTKKSEKNILIEFIEREQKLAESVHTSFLSSL